MTRLLDQAEFDATIADRRFEDYVPGGVYEYGEITLDEADIIDFGRRWDPQTFHVDPQAAAAGPFQGLIASGWQTCAAMRRLFAEHYLSHTASLGAPGVDELRWLRPVRPGDKLRLRVTVLDARSSRTQDDRGLVRTLAELRDPSGEPVFRCVVMNLVGRRTPVTV